MVRIKEGIKKSSDGIYTLSAILLLFIFIYIFIDVVMRFFKLPPVGDVVELTGYLNVWMVCLSLGVIYRKGRHIEVDIVTSRISSKAKIILKRITSIVSIIFCFLMVYEGIAMVIRSYEIGHRSMSWNFIVWPFQIVVPLGFLFLMLEIILELIESTHNEGSKE